MPKKTCVRYRFVRDDDGHDYIIPADEEKQFLQWLDAGPYWNNYRGKRYDDCRTGCSPTLFTFLDPKEDE